MWKGDILVADIEELGKVDASEIHARRLNAKEVVIFFQKRSVNMSYSKLQMEQQNCVEEIVKSENPL